MYCILDQWSQIYILSYICSFFSFTETLKGIKTGEVNYSDPETQFLSRLLLEGLMTPPLYSNLHHLCQRHSREHIPCFFVKGDRDHPFSIQNYLFMLMYIGRKGSSSVILEQKRCSLLQSLTKATELFSQS